jgi:coatomer subunit beta'
MTNVCVCVKPLKLEIKRVMSARSDRVKCVDIHPTEPWVVAALYTGHIFLWNYQNETLIKSFKVSKVPGSLVVCIW